MHKQMTALVSRTRWGSLRTGLALLVASQAVPALALTIVPQLASVSAPQPHDAPTLAAEQHAASLAEPSGAFKAAGWIAILSIFALVGTTARRRSPSRIVTS